MPRPTFTNRLIHEKSPYLLQHAHNPVDWYPWGEEAFAAAKEEGKPIFLSIGYATCHWCHVMEKESFEDLGLAKLLNETFINVKIDREEMPDVDSLYMEFAQAMMSGGAGWPLNLILTPERLPFFAAAYLPPDTSRGVLGFRQLILRIGTIWADQEERENVISQAGKIVDIFAHQTVENSLDLPKKEQIAEAADLLFKTADPIYGGNKGAPKFPMGFQCCFLLQWVKQSADSRALFYVERTLEMMHRGGIYDHLGGGFSRYTVDDKWLFPHFEKMSYDNAILIRTYLEMYAYTRHNYYREVIEEVITYVLRDLHADQGGFYAAEDADSEGEEGAFYTWTWEQIHEVLGQQAPLFCDFYSVTPVGNYEGKNVLHMHQSLNEFAEQLRLDPLELSQQLQQAREKLWQEREKRVHPAIDDKIITGWNGLMISAFMQAGMVLNNPRYIEIATEAAQFIKEHLWTGEKLLRRWREGEAKFDGCLDDYAFMIQASLNLFEADISSEWLEFALTLANNVQALFCSDSGAYYMSGEGDENLLFRRSEFYDGAEPSGNAVQTENLIRLYQITQNSDYLKQAEAILKAAKPHIDMYPPGACYHMIALMRYYDLNRPTLIVALNEQQECREEIVKMFAGHYMPNGSIIWHRQGDEELRDMIPFLRHVRPIQEKTTLCICYPNRCLRPITELSEMWKAIEQL